MTKLYSFKSALDERGFDQEVENPSAKRMLAYQIERAMARKGLSRVEMAEKMNTSRAALNRLLDTENNSVTLLTIQTAAEVLDMEIEIRLQAKGEVQ